MATPATDFSLNATASPTEYSGQVTWSPAIAILMAVIACLGAVGNMFIIGAVFLERRLRARGNAFIVNLAVADLIVTAYIMPIGIATSQYKLKPFSDTLCDFNAFLFITTCGVSTQSLMLIAIERYIHVCQLAWYDKVYRKGLVAFYIILAWAYTMAISAQGWTGWTHYYYGHDYYLCLFYGPESMSYDICLSVFGIVLPVIVLIFCYVSIFRTVNSSKKAIAAHAAKSPTIEAKLRRKQNRDSQFIFMLVVIVIVFCICWAPGACVMALSGALGPDGLPVLAYTITIWTALCNSSMNSIIYGIMNRNFRRGYASIARRIFCCCCPGKEKQCCSCAVTSRDGSSSSNARTQSAENKHSSKKSDIDTATEFSTLPFDKTDKSKKVQPKPNGAGCGSPVRKVKAETKNISPRNSDTYYGQGRDNQAFIIDKDSKPSVKRNWEHIDKSNKIKGKDEERQKSRPEKESKKQSKNVKGNWEKLEKHSNKNAQMKSGEKNGKTRDKPTAKLSPSVKGNWEKLGTSHHKKQHQDQSIPISKSKHASTKDKYNELLFSAQV